jgi:hypothetical protein
VRRPAVTFFVLSGAARIAYPDAVMGDRCGLASMGETAMTIASDPAARHGIDGDEEARCWRELGFVDGGCSDEEARCWRELGFVDGGCSWAPLRVPEAEQARRHGEACRIGALYALDAIGHLKRFPHNPDRLVDLLRHMVLAGRWSAVEIGFAFALSDYLARGRITVAEDFEVVDLRRAA